jgi:AcrR family transcriptional regulator
MRTRSLLLDAAIDLFGSRGFEATSMRDIAARAGVGAPAMYNHFPSKDAVLVAALVTRLERFREAVLVPDDPDSPPAPRLEGFVRRHVAQQIGSGATSRSVDRLLDAVRSGQVLTEKHQRDAVQEYLDAYRAVMSGVLDELRETVPARLPPTPVTVEAILGLCDRSPAWYPTEELHMTTAQDDCWRLVAGMVGLAGRRERDRSRA